MGGGWEEESEKDKTHAWGMGELKQGSNPQIRAIIFGTEEKHLRLRVK